MQKIISHLTVGCTRIHQPSTTTSHRTRTIDQRALQLIELCRKFSFSRLLLLSYNHLYLFHVWYRLLWQVTNNGCNLKSQIKSSNKHIHTVMLYTYIYEWIYIRIRWMALAWESSNTTLVGVVRFCIRNNF